MLFFGGKSTIGSMAHKLEALVRGKLWLQIILSLLLGLGVGIALGPDFSLLSKEHAAIAGEWLALPGELFLRMIKMILIPLVFFSIARGLGASDITKLKAIGPKFMVYLLCTTTFACTAGMTLATVLKPGTYIDMKISTTEGLDVLQNGDEKKLSDIIETLPETALNIIPENPLAAAANEEMLGIVIFALMIGFAFTLQPNRKIKPILEMADGIMDVLMTIVKWAMMLAPLAAFGLTARMAIQAGVKVIFGLGMYVSTVLIGLLLLVLLYTLLVFILKKISPMRFFRSVAPLQLLAFSTSSSAAVMPYSIQTAVEKLDTEEETAEIIVPLGTTINMDGTAIYQSIAIMFMAQVSGFDLGIGQMILVVVTLVGSSIGTPGTPGVGIAILLTIAGNIGIPSAGHALLLGVDRLLDRFRTVVNVTGDITACVLFGSKK